MLQYIHRAARLMMRDTKLCEGAVSERFGMMMAANASTQMVRPTNSVYLDTLDHGKGQNAITHEAPTNDRKI
jgi:hypothetical protein